MRPHRRRGRQHVWLGGQLLRLAGCPRRPRSTTPGSRRRPCMGWRMTSDAEFADELDEAARVLCVFGEQRPAGGTAGAYLGRRVHVPGGRAGGAVGRGDGEADPAPCPALPGHPRRGGAHATRGSTVCLRGTHRAGGGPVPRPRQEETSGSTAPAKDADRARKAPAKRAAAKKTAEPQLSRRWVISSFASWPSSPASRALSTRSSAPWNRRIPTGLRHQDRAQHRPWCVCVRPVRLGQIAAGYGLSIGLLICAAFFLLATTTLFFLPSTGMRQAPARSGSSALRRCGLALFTRVS